MNVLDVERRQVLSSWLKNFLFALLAVCCLTACDRSKDIVHNLQEREANEIIVYLNRRGIQAQKVQEVKGGGGAAQGPVLYMVTVHSSVWVEAMALLNAAGLPRRPTKGLLDIFGEGGLVATEREEQIKYQAGLEQQIAATLLKIDGVLEADVALSVPEENPLNPEAVVKDKTASVYIKHQGVLDDPNSHLKTKIKQLVASAVDGLEFENVSVISDRARFTGDPEGEILFGRDDEEETVLVWSITIAKSSLGRFQMIFAGLIVTILILGLLIVLLIWKFLPILAAAGGFSQLLRFSPIQPEQVKGVKSAAGKAGKEEGSTLTNIEEESEEELEEEEP